MHHEIRPLSQQMDAHCSDHRSRNHHYDYNARWYDPALGHFLSPDSIVPAAGNALDYHRYGGLHRNRRPRSMLCCVV